jgi:ribosome-interacting GTPase 1
MDMLDLKNYSNEELQELKYSINKELFNRNIFTEYNVGEIYCQTRLDGRFTFFYIIKKVDDDVVYVDCISVYDDYIDYSDELEYTYKDLDEKKLKKIEISENEINEWYDELSKKLWNINFNTKKEVNTLINLYLEKIK